MTRVLVCGGRNLDAADVWDWLERNLRDALQERFGHQAWPVTVLMHGGANGADGGAGLWAGSENIKILAFEADWKRHGRAAGPIRNSTMLRDGKPDVVVAFPGGKGTANMKSQAEEFGVPVIEAFWRRGWK